MSYCVNCGVELAASEKRCPLCGVEVLNPAQPTPDNPWQPYPHRDDPLIERLNRRFFAAVLFIALAFPTAICLAIDYIYVGHLSWSLYVAGALAMLWCWLAPAFLQKKPTFLKVMPPVSLSLAGYLYWIEKLQPHPVQWFLPLALPLVLWLTVIVTLIALLSQAKIIQGFAIPASLLVAVGLIAAGTDLLISHYLEKGWRMSWSWFVLISCLAVAGLFLVIARRQKMRTEIHRRLHV